MKIFKLTLLASLLISNTAFADFICRGDNILITQIVSTNTSSRTLIHCRTGSIEATEGLYTESAFQGQITALALYAKAKDKGLKVYQSSNSSTWLYKVELVD